MIEITSNINHTFTKTEKFIPSSVRRTELNEKFKSKIIHNPSLTRQLVSFQANKQIPFYGWFKYRGFSELLVTYILQNLRPQPGILLDPFAGGGSALFAASALKWQTIGIELLPAGIYAIQARLVANKINPEEFRAVAVELMQINFTEYYDQEYAFQHLAITRGAFPSTNEKQLVGYIYYCHKFVLNNDIRTLLLYAAFCILEDISYTRKDGQYLRWDARSERSQGKKKFHKGIILTFSEAIQNKLNQIASDLSSALNQQNLFSNNFLQQNTVKDTTSAKEIKPILHQDSCLKILPTIATNSIDFVLTSPPYVNRYDYTRTYALELVFLGCHSILDFGFWILD